MYRKIKYCSQEIVLKMILRDLCDHTKLHACGAVVVMKGNWFCGKGRIKTSAMKAAGVKILH